MPADNKWLTLSLFMCHTDTRKRPHVRRLFRNGKFFIKTAVLWALQKLGCSPGWCVIVAVTGWLRIADECNSCALAAIYKSSAIGFPWPNATHTHTSITQTEKEPSANNLKSELRSQSINHNVNRILSSMNWDYNWLLPNILRLYLWIETNANKTTAMHTER